MKDFRWWKKKKKESNNSHTKIKIFEGLVFATFFCLLVPKPLNKRSRRSVGSQSSRQPLHNQLDGKSIATRLVPTQLLWDRHYRAPVSTQWLGSRVQNGAVWVQPGSLLTSLLASCVLAGCFTHFTIDLLLPFQ